MTAGTGVRHSEFNGSKDKPLHLLQIWLLPAGAGILPKPHEQKAYSTTERTGTLRLSSARATANAGSVTIHQDVKIYRTILDPGQAIEDRLGEDRYGWIRRLRAAY